MISLHFTTHRIVSARYDHVPITVIRLKGWVKLLRADDTFGEARHAIIDTGAFVSIIPLHIWQGLALSISADSVTFGGINPHPECQVPSVLGQVTGILVDRESHLSPECVFPAFLAKTDQVPLILGFANLLSRFKICFDYDNGEAFALPTGAG